MDTSDTRSTPTAPSRQWDDAAPDLLDLGHTVELVEPVAGPARHGLRRQRRIDRQRQGRRRALRHPQRDGRAGAYAAWMTDHGYAAVRDPARQRGPGRSAARRLDDAGGHTVSAPTGAPTTRSPSISACRWSALRAGRPALLPPRHRAGRARRHDRSPTTRRRSPSGRGPLLHELFPDAIEVASRRRVRARAQRGLRWPARRTSRRRAPDSPGSCDAAGFDPVGVDLSELLKGGGSVKCCTLEVH